MFIDRKYITPIMAGAMLLSGVTGLLMFFDVANDFQEEIHEFLGIVLVAGASLHVFLNWPALKKQLKTPRGKLIFGLFAATFLLSFMGGLGDMGEFEDADD